MSMSQQFGLFDVAAVEAPDSAKRARLNFRPANMRTVHGVRIDGEFRRDTHSVSCVQCVEDRLLDAQFVRESGGGMDAPEDLPLGSVKAMFWDESTGISSSYPRLTGLCQRTYRRR
jgi:hypothetical protein